MSDKDEEVRTYVVQIDPERSLTVTADRCAVEDYGSAVLSLSGTTTQIIAVQDNTTALAVDADALGLTVINVQSYLEAIGVIATQRAGIDPTALSAHQISHLQKLATPSLQSPDG